MSEAKNKLKVYSHRDEKEKTFRALMEQYQKKVYYQVRRMLNDHDDANDVVQNIFIKVWLHLDEFRGDAAFSTWLYRITANETLNFIAARKRKATTSLDNQETGLMDSLQSENSFSGTEIQKKLHQAIQKLPPKQRMVFNLKYFDEMPYAQMSEIIGTSQGALKASFHHAVKKIENFILEN